MLVPGFKAAVKNGSTASELRRRCTCVHHGDVRNPAWTSLVPGNNYPVELRFDNGAYEQWSGIVERMTDGSPVLG